MSAKTVATEPVVLNPRGPIRVALTYCSGDMVHADFANVLVMLAIYTRQNGVLANIVNPRATIAWGRHKGVVTAQMMNADYLFFIDSDMLVPPEAIIRLLAHKKPIVGASYCQRALPFLMTHTGLDGVRGMFRDSETGLREVSRLPTGCMLIDMKVFEKFEKPYFRVAYPGDGREVSEDNTFCDLARERGFSVWMDCDLTKEVRHIGIYPYSYQDRVEPEQRQTA